MKEAQSLKNKKCPNEYNNVSATQLQGPSKYLLLTTFSCSNHNTQEKIKLNHIVFLIPNMFVFHHKPKQITQG